MSCHYLRQACAAWGVPGHPGLHSEILSKENKGARTPDAGGWAGEMVQQVKHLLDKPDMLSSIPVSDGRTGETNSPELFFGFHYSTSMCASSMCASAHTHRHHLHIIIMTLRKQTTLNTPPNFILTIGH